MQSHYDGQVLVVYVDSEVKAQAGDGEEHTPTQCSLFTPDTAEETFQGTYNPHKQQKRVTPR